MMKNQLCMMMLILILLTATACSVQENTATTTTADVTQTTVAPLSENAQPTASGKAELTFIGRSSIKIVTAKGIIIYVDPYATAPGAYSEPADYILVTHGHDDHDAVSKVTKKESTVTIKCPQDIKAGDIKDFEGLRIKAVEAYNDNHPKGTGCGYILTFDDLVVYHSGDTSKIPEMDAFVAEGITYALLCADGYYNMDAVEAMEVAKIIQAKYYIPMHTAGTGYYSAENDAAFNLENTFHLKPTESLVLEP